MAKTKGKKVSPIIHTCRSIRDAIGMSEDDYLQIMNNSTGKRDELELTHHERRIFFDRLDKVWQWHKKRTIRLDNAPVSDEEALEILG